MVAVAESVNEHAFSVVARIYAHIVVVERKKPYVNLASIGRDFGLNEQQVQSCRLKATYHARKRGRPFSADDKNWIWPSSAEERRERDRLASASAA